MNNKNQIIYGRNPVLEALHEGVTIERIWMLQSLRGPIEKEVRQISKERNIPLSVLAKDRLQRIVKGNHQGLAASIALIEYQQLNNLLPQIYENYGNPLIVLLDRVTDVRNFGAIARSALICGAHGLVIGHKNSAPVNAEAVKTSAGALRKIPVCREKSLTQTISFLKNSGVKVIGAALEGTHFLHNLDLEGPLAIMVGSEGEGIHPSLLKHCDEVYKIPQVGDLDSFNVSVAAGISLYEAMKQRLGG